MYIATEDGEERRNFPQILENLSEIKIFGHQKENIWKKQKFFVLLNRLRFKVKTFFLEITTILGQNLTNQRQIYTLKTFFYVFI